MDEKSAYENSWNELLKVSRAWQMQWDVQQLLSNIAHTAHDLLVFEQTTVFLLDKHGVSETACWPNPMVGNATASELRLEIAQGVIQAGRMAFVRKESAKRTVLCAPLVGSREIMGALYLETTKPERNISEKDQQFVEMFAQQAAACLEHTRLYQSAITDPLTGLFCHRYFQQEVEQAVRRAMRNERPVSLLLMDLDHFKKLNDTCGHQVGNQCLLQVAAALRKAFRSTDILARFGGDEFEMLLPDTAGEQAQLVAENVRKKICDMQFPQERKVSATIGIACYPQNSSEAQALFLCADAALYKAKEAGRNRVMLSLDKLQALNGTVANTERAALLTGRHARQEPSDEIDARLVSPAGIEMVDGHIVVRRLGSGSTGEVLLAIQPGLEREVALKRPLTPHLTFEQAQTFDQEAKVTASLNHPGVAPVHTIGRDHDSRRYYTMKPLAGLTLEEILESRRKGNMEILHQYTPGKLLDILLRVAETIAYAHERGVLHLDIRPSNIIVGKFGEVTVIDWATGSGSAERRSERGSNSELRLVGSPAYLAPELVRGGPKNKSTACDVFALGTLLYLLLTDRLPFQREATAATLDALLKGEFIPPEQAVSDAGIDSLLSALCAETLSLNPADRPGAQSFAQRLGLCIRHEADYTTIRFGEGGRPLLESEWTVQRQEWKLAGDHWVFSGGSDDGILVWNMAAPGSFRYSCECWVESAGAELGIIGHRPPRGSQNYRYAGGYFFEVGAEHGTLTKLARHEADVLVRPAGSIEPGRRYLIEMEYQDTEGLLHCAIDGKRIFTYRELFPFPGSQIGFYGSGGTAHFRPLKLERQVWGLLIPALHAADRNFQHGHFELALECYQEIAPAMPGRPAGIEATLKVGMCQAQLGRLEQAKQSFNALKGTTLEPFALAEEAMLDVETDPAGCLELFRTLFERYPDSQARLRILDASRFNNRWQNAAGSHALNLQARVDLNRIGAKRFQPPAQSQIGCQNRAAELQLRLGQSNEALRELLEFRRTLFPHQRLLPGYQEQLTMLALATGREELLPDELHRCLDWLNTGFNLVFHCAVRKNEVNSLLHLQNHASLQHGLRLSLHLCQKDIHLATAFLRDQVLTDPAFSVRSVSYSPGWCSSIGEILIDAREPALLDPFVAALSHEPLVPACQARFAFNAGGFEEAARHISSITGEYVPSTYDFERGVYLQKICLTSLGLLKVLSAAELSSQMERYICGPMLELAQMFLGEREPRPTGLWPHPLWRPEWRLWLGLWLEAKGRKQEALDVVSPSRDARFGLTNSQPAIEALLKRLA